VSYAQSARSSRHFGHGPCRSNTGAQVGHSGQHCPILELSVSYTESLVKVLKQNDLLQASRGPGGGYQLKRDLQTLTAWDVVKCFEIIEQSDPEKRPSSETLAVDLLYEEYLRIAKRLFEKLFIEFTGQGSACQCADSKSEQFAVQLQAFTQRLDACCAQLGVRPVEIHATDARLSFSTFQCVFNFAA